MSIRAAVHVVRAMKRAENVSDHKTPPRDTPSHPTVDNDERRPWDERDNNEPGCIFDPYPE